jgi:hypothetical protein
MEEVLLLAAEGTWHEQCKTEIHKAKPLVHELSHFEVQITTEELPGTDQILAEIIQERCKILCSMF